MNGEGNRGICAMACWSLRISVPQCSLKTNLRSGFVGRSPVFKWPSSACHPGRRFPKLLVMASEGQATEPKDKPSPWRFIRWHKANERQAPAIAGKKEEQKKGNFVYKVVPGETLSGIAEKFNTYVEVLMEANNILNPNNVAPGELLWIPQTYRIMKGDTLYSLARKFGVKVESIQAANGIEDKNLIYAGDIIVIPEEAESEEVGMIKK